MRASLGYSGGSRPVRCKPFGKLASLLLSQIWWAYELMKLTAEMVHIYSVRRWNLYCIHLSSVKLNFINKHVNTSLPFHLTEAEAHKFSCKLPHLHFVATTYPRERTGKLKWFFDTDQAALSLICPGTNLWGSSVGQRAGYVYLII